LIHAFTDAQKYLLIGIEMFEKENLIEDLLNRIGVSLQISDSKHEEVSGHYEAVGNWLAEDEDLEHLNPTVYPQGSFAIGTTVKPIGQQEHDVDLVVEFDSWDQSADDLYNAVRRRIESNGNYGDKTEPKQRCVRICYADNFHLDVLPARPDSTGMLPVGSIDVPDRKLEDWKESNPKGYIEWFEDAAFIVEERRILLEASVEQAPRKVPYEWKPPLKRAVQLIKRWRDIRYESDPENSPISIVLTTLAAEGYRKAESTLEALGQILDYIVDSVPEVGRLVVKNPGNEKEDFSEKWDEEPQAYKAFLEGIYELHQKWKSLIGLSNDEALQVLSELFGGKLAKQVLVERTKWISDLSREGAVKISATGGLVASSDVLAKTEIPAHKYFGE